MKNYISVVLMLLFMGTQTALCQFVHVHLNNTDTKTREVLAKTIVSATSRATVQKDMEKKLDDMVKHQKWILDNKYGKNKYDSESSFVTTAATTMAASLGSNLIESKLANGYYLTKNKREFMSDIDLDKAVLFALQKLDYDNITAGSRQEIYRLRNEIAKGFSKNDSEVLNLLLLPAARHIAEGDAALSTVIKTLELIE